MNGSANTKPSVAYADGFFTVSFEGGASMRFPVEGNPRLAAGSPDQLSHVVVSHFGIHWPDLDEDLSFEGLARGDYGQRAFQPV